MGLGPPSLTTDELKLTRPRRISLDSAGDRTSAFYSLPDGLHAVRGLEYQTTALMPGTLTTSTVIMNGQMCKAGSTLTFTGHLTIRDTYTLDPHGFNKPDSDRNWLAELKVQLVRSLCHGLDYPVSVVPIPYYETTSFWRPTW